MYFRNLTLAKKALHYQSEARCLSCLDEGGIGPAKLCGAQWEGPAIFENQLSVTSCQWPVATGKSFECDILHVTPLDARSCAEDFQAVLCFQYFAWRNGDGAAK